MALRAKDAAGNTPAVGPTPTAHSPTATPGTFNDPGNSASLNTHFMSGVAHQTSGPGLSPAPAIQPRTYNMAQGSILGEHSVSTIGSGNEPQDLQKLLYGKPGESEEQFKQTDLPAMMKRLQPGNQSPNVPGGPSQTGTVPSPTMASSPNGTISATASRY